MAVVFELQEGKEEYRCGATLIHPQVLTSKRKNWKNCGPSKHLIFFILILKLAAAHCVHNISASKLKVRAGEWDIKNLVEFFDHHDRDVSEILTHDAFDKENLHNDIALLFLKDPMPIKKARGINVACLPPQDYNFENSSGCVATGTRHFKLNKLNQLNLTSSLQDGEKTNTEKMESTKQSWNSLIKPLSHSKNAKLL